MEHEVNKKWKKTNLIIIGIEIILLLAIIFGIYTLSWQSKEKGRLVGTYVSETGDMYNEDVIVFTEDMQYKIYKDTTGEVTETGTYKSNGEFVSLINDSSSYNVIHVNEKIYMTHNDKMVIYKKTATVPVFKSIVS